MHTGKAYKFREFLNWTRRDIYVLIVLGVVAVVAYQIGSMKWLAIPSTVVALLGTATAFIIGFKNTWIREKFLKEGNVMKQLP